MHSIADPHFSSLGAKSSAGPILACHNALMSSLHASFCIFTRMGLGHSCNRCDSTAFTAKSSLGVIVVWSGLLFFLVVAGYLRGAERDLSLHGLVRRLLAWWPDTSWGIRCMPFAE